MSDDANEVDLVPTDVDIRGWVEGARNDPNLLRARQVTEIVLTAIGLTPTLKNGLVLKGGTLMAIAFRSSRVTGDVDFSATIEPDGFEELLRAELNPALERAARQLRYLDIVCQIQGIKKKPRALNFEEYQFPALDVHIASAKRGTPEEARLRNRQALNVVRVEISFRDQVYAFQELSLNGAGVAVNSFAITEIIAEKLRALLQQIDRNRYRRQDIYDIAYLLERFSISEADKANIFSVFQEKCRTRGIVPMIESITNEEVVRRARQDWGTLEAEVGTVPPFDTQYEMVRIFYESLPWPQ